MGGLLVLLGGYLRWYVDKEFDLLLNSLKIAIVGQQCAGKSSVAKAVVKTIGNGGRVARVKFADPIYRVLAALDVDKNRGFMQEFSDLSKKYFGDLVFVKIFAETIEKLESSEINYDLIICDDVRYHRQMEVVKLLGFKVIYVAADEKVRRKRAEDQGLEFIENHNSENKVKEVGKFADVHLDNSTDNIKMLENRIAFLLRHKLAA